jgi:hypothetical protein
VNILSDNIVLHYLAVYGIVTDYSIGIIFNLKLSSYNEPLYAAARGFFGTGSMPAVNILSGNIVLHCFAV